MQSFPFIHWWSIKVIIFSGGEDIRDFCLVVIVVMMWDDGPCANPDPFYQTMTSWWALELQYAFSIALPPLWNSSPLEIQMVPAPQQSMLGLFSQALGLGGRWTLLWLMCFLVNGVIIYPWLPGIICWDFSIFNLCKSPRVTCMRWAAL